MGGPARSGIDNLAPCPITSNWRLDEPEFMQTRPTASPLVLLAIRDHLQCRCCLSCLIAMRSIVGAAPVPNVDRENDRLEPEGSDVAQWHLLQFRARGRS